MYADKEIKIFSLSRDFNYSYLDVKYYTTTTFLQKLFVGPVVHILLHNIIFQGLAKCAKETEVILNTNSEITRCFTSENSF